MFYVIVWISTFVVANKPFILQGETQGSQRQRWKNAWAYGHSVLTETVNNT